MNVKKIQNYREDLQGQGFSDSDKTILIAAAIITDELLQIRKTLEEIHDLIVEKA